MSGIDPETRRRPEQTYYCSARGSIFYTPRNPLERNKTRSPAPPSFPIPHIQPRQRRPQSIHIVSYPAGFIPHELRPKPPPRASDRRREAKKQKRQERKEAANRQLQEDRARRQQTGFPPTATKFRVLGQLVAALSSSFKVTADSGPAELSPSTTTATTPGLAPPPTRPVSSAASLESFARRLSRPETGSILHQDTMTRPLSMVDSLRPSIGSAISPMSAHSSHRNSLMSVRSAKSLVMSSSVTELSKPVASGSGVSCSIILAEPYVFLTGFDHDGQSRHESHNSTALLRGKLQLKVSKNVKIKSIALKLVGKARTEWPEGIPPTKVDMFEEEVLRMQSLLFFHAMHEDIWETEFGNQCTHKLKGNPNGSAINLRLSPNGSNVSLQHPTRSRGSSNLTAKELKRLSLQSVQSRSFGKGDSPLANAVQAKGFKVFYPGTYEYSFELPIDHHQLETTKLQYGSVKWELETTVERAGTFKPNLHGSKEVNIVRVPDQLSLEMTEPISISRQWEDQLHYDIIISGKSFPVGGKIPIAFKLTPLAKVQVHKLKVFVTETAEYWTNDRRVTRKDPGRKILLLEKSAGKPLEKQYEQSDVRVVAGGELSPQEREEARLFAARRRAMDAARLHQTPQPLPEPTDNLLGDLELGLESYWGSTEIEMNVQIPTCEMMAKDKTVRLHPDCSWKNVNVYHWIKIVMRISRADPDDPTGKRRRHFEISIDSPFTVLNCRATQANTLLPQYTGSCPIDGTSRLQTSCGCFDAARVSINTSPSSSTGTLTLVEQETGNASPRGINRVNTSDLPLPPQAAHLHTNGPRQNGAGTPTSIGPSSASPLQRVRASEPVVHQRPMHLMRYPSYDPPAFEDDQPPPPVDLMTPPPNYDLIVGTPSFNGLDDYFSRLSEYEHPSDDNITETEDHATPSASEAVVDVGAGDYLTHRTVIETDVSTPEEDDDSDSGSENIPARIHSGGRVNVANPRTPGGRLVPSRSLEFERPVMNLSLAGVVRRA